MNCVTASSPTDDPNSNKNPYFEFMKKNNSCFWHLIFYIYIFPLINIHYIPSQNRPLLYINKIHYTNLSFSHGESKLNAHLDISYSSAHPNIPNELRYLWRIFRSDTTNHNRDWIPRGYWWEEVDAVSCAVLWGKGWSGQCPGQELVGVTITVDLRVILMGSPPTPPHPISPPPVCTTAPLGVIRARQQTWTGKRHYWGLTLIPLESARISSWPTRCSWLYSEGIEGWFKSDKIEAKMLE